MLELERIKQLDDEVLIERLTQSVQRDRQLSVELLIELSEVQDRGLFRDLGFSTMFDYATRRLGMSESEAALRLRAAKLARAFPIALEMLARCEIHLTALGLLAPVLKSDNVQLLYEARFKTKQQVQQLIARYAPKRDVPDSIRRIPRPSPSARPSARALQPHVQITRSIPSPMSPLASIGARATAVEQVSLAASTDARDTSPSPPVHARPAAAAELVPLSPDRHKITFTASQRVRDMLEEARELRRHRDPAGQLEALFERALELLIADEKKRRFGQTSKPRQPRKSASPKPRSRYIPHEVRRQVWRRDDGQCCFCGPDGLRCGARSRLQFHHKIPYERGGPTSTENLELMCAAHNALLAERDYGRSFILQVRRAKVARPRASLVRRRSQQPAIAREIRARECIQHPEKIEAQIDSKQLAAALTDEQLTWPQL